MHSGRLNFISDIAKLRYCVAMGQLDHREVQIFSWNQVQVISDELSKICMDGLYLIENSLGRSCPDDAAIDLLRVCVVFLTGLVTVANFLLMSQVLDESLVSRNRVCLSIGEQLNLLCLQVSLWVSYASCTRF